MKLFRILALAVAALFVTPAAMFAAVPSPYTGSQPIQTGGPGDVTTYLGAFPLFPTGFVRDPYGNEFRFVTDSTATTPAAVGSWLYFTGSTWIAAATANLAVPRGSYGVVVVAAAAQGGVATIQTQGYYASANVKTGGSVACAATGNVPLASTTTAGVVTPTVAATVPGVTWGYCAGVLAISQSSTPTAVVIGGY